MEDLRRRIESYIVANWSLCPIMFLNSSKRDDLPHISISYNFELDNTNIGASCRYYTGTILLRAYDKTSNGVGTSLRLLDEFYKLLEGVPGLSLRGYTTIPDIDSEDEDPNFITGMMVDFFMKE